MRKKIVFLLLAVLFTGLVAEEMSYDEIAKDYKKSFDYETLGKYEKAIQSLKSVYTNYPGTYTVNYRLGWLYYLNGNYANALEHLKKALTTSEYSIEVMNTMILVRVAQQDWSLSEELCAKVIKIDYYNYIANYWYGYSQKMQGKYNAAIIVNRKMLTIFPTAIVFLVELAENLFLNNEIAESISIFESVSVLDPDNATAKAYLKKK
jgi:tetratricopeptide (TPR) repeat protein